MDAIRRMANRGDPASYTAQEVQDYLLHMVREQSLSYSTMNQAACAARFLFPDRVNFVLQPHQCWPCRTASPDVGRQTAGLCP